MLEQLRADMPVANLTLPVHHLVAFTWGSASAIGGIRQRVVIKPPGVEYGAMIADNTVVAEITNGKVMKDSREPSSDTPTHPALYRRFTKTGGIVHTHSRHITIWSQAELDLLAWGTTHADCFHGATLCTCLMTAEEINDEYEYQTDEVAIKALEEHGLSLA